MRCSAQVGATQRFEPMLAALAAGMVIQNIAAPQGDALKMAIQGGALPILVVFFVGIGTSLELGALMQIGMVATGLMLARIAVIRLGVATGLRVSGIDRETGRYLWTGLISQAGITLGLAAVIAMEFPTWGVRLQTLLVALIAIDELVGPALFRIGLARTGEIDRSARRPLIVVSNREPYLHNYADDGSIVLTQATGGVAVALDALMRERGGTWIAHGDGTRRSGGRRRRRQGARASRCAVLPVSGACGWNGRNFRPTTAGSPTKACGPSVIRSTCVRSFAATDWTAYQAVNDKFAAVIDEELPTTDTPVFIQDYHLALVAQRLRVRRPQARTALFWHIPWPYPDRLRICPWSRAILEGLLANDLLAFQLERDRRNFLLAVEEGLAATIEADGETVRHAGRVTTVTAVPIGVDFDRIQAVARDPELEREQDRLRREFDLRAELIGLGVDRLDYTKGIPERLEALNRIFTRQPALRGRLTFVQIGVPSRSDLGSYSRARISHRPQGRRDQRPPWTARPSAACLLPQGRAEAAQPGRPLPSRPVLCRQLAARRDESGRERVRRGQGRR